MCIVYILKHFCNRKLSGRTGPDVSGDGAPVDLAKHLEGWVASAIQIVTAIGIVVAYSRSRIRVGESKLCGVFGNPFFQIFAVACNLLATVGTML